MMKCYSNLNLMENVEILYYEMKKKNLNLNEHIFVTILFGFFNHKNFLKMEEFFEKMIELKIKPNNKISSIILTSSFKFHSFEKFEFYLKKIKKFEIKFDSKNYTIIICNYLSKKDKINDALNYFEEMKKKKIQPTFKIFESFIDFYVKKKDEKKMIEFLNEAEKLKLIWNEIIFEKIILYYCENKKLKEAEKLLNKMIKFKFPIINSYNYLLKEYAKENDIQTLYRLYKQSRKYSFIQIDQNTFEVLLIKFSKEKQFDSFPTEVYLHYLEKEISNL